MVMRRQFWNSDVLPHEYNLGEGIRQLHREIRRSASISGKPFDHPGVGGMVVVFPHGPVRICFPVDVGEASGVLVVRIVRVRVLERCLRKGQQ